MIFQTPSRHDLEAAICTNSHGQPRSAKDKRWKFHMANRIRELENDLHIAICGKAFLSGETVGFRLTGIGRYGAHWATIAWTGDTT